MIDNEMIEKVRSRAMIVLAEYPQTTSAHNFALVVMAFVNLLENDMAIAEMERRNE
jgi:hypothetical protein